MSRDGRTLLSGGGDTAAILWDLTGRARTKPVEELTDAQRDRYWRDLSGPASQAHRAVWALATDARRSVPYLAERLRPAQPVEAKRLARLLDDLADDSFAVRERASAALEKLGKDIVPELRRVAAGGVLEARRRAEMILALIELTPLTPEQLRALRAVEVLERAGGPEARRVLETLAGGAPPALLTLEARSTLERLRKAVSRPE